MVRSRQGRNLCGDVHSRLRHGPACAISQRTDGGLCVRWARGNGCPWSAETRDLAAAKLGYTDDLGNLVG